MGAPTDSADVRRELQSGKGGAAGRYRDDYATDKCVSKAVINAVR